MQRRRTSHSAAKLAEQAKIALAIVSPSSEDIGNCKPFSLDVGGDEVSDSDNDGGNEELTIDPPLAKHVHDNAPPAPEVEWHEAILLYNSALVYMNYLHTYNESMQLYGEGKRKGWQSSYSFDFDINCDESVQLSSFDSVGVVSFSPMSKAGSLDAIQAVASPMKPVGIRDYSVGGELVGVFVKFHTRMYICDCIFLIFQCRLHDIHEDVNFCLFIHLFIYLFSYVFNILRYIVYYIYVYVSYRRASGGELFRLWLLVCRADNQSVST